MIRDTEAYRLISQHYEGKTAQRSGVPLINHINEGIEILRRYGSDQTVMEAYAIHPLLQNDDDLKANRFSVLNLNPLVVLYAMEYRQTANDFLSGEIFLSPPYIDGDSYFPARRKNIKLSCLGAVNEMLVADKVQNRKDFLAYHKGTHARSVELDYYFKYWLEVLGISEEQYSELVKGL